MRKQCSYKKVASVGLLFVATWLCPGCDATLEGISLGVRSGVSSVADLIIVRIADALLDDTALATDEN